MTMHRFMKYLPLVVTLFLFSVLAVIPGRTAAEGSDSSSDPAMYSTDWRNTGPPGGDVRGLVVDPTNPDRFYFGKPRLFVDHIIVDPRNPHVLYVGAHRHKEPGGFFKSTDGGLSFRESPELKN